MSHITDFLGWFGGYVRLSARCEAGHHDHCTYKKDGGCQCSCHKED